MDDDFESDDVPLSNHKRKKLKTEKVEEKEAVLFRNLRVIKVYGSPFGASKTAMMTDTSLKTRMYYKVKNVNYLPSLSPLVVYSILPSQLEYEKDSQTIFKLIEPIDTFILDDTLTLPCDDVCNWFSTTCNFQVYKDIRDKYIESKVRSLFVRKVKVLFN